MKLMYLSLPYTRYCRVTSNRKTDYALRRHARAHLQKRLLVEKVGNIIGYQYEFSPFLSNIFIQHVSLFCPRMQLYSGGIINAITNQWFFDSMIANGHNSKEDCFARHIRNQSCTLFYVLQSTADQEVSKHVVSIR